MRDDWATDDLDRALDLRLELEEGKEEMAEQEDQSGTDSASELP